MATRPKGLGWIIGLLIFACIATAGYWIAFFTSSAVQGRSDAVYIEFEKAFPVADGWMALCALLAAIGLWRGRSWGFLFGLLAASSSIFLGLMDVTFDVNEGIYLIGGVNTALEIVINVLTLGLGPVLIIYLWKNRRFYLGKP